MAATNHHVIALLQELVTLTTLEDESPQSFRVRAYEKAVQAVQAAPGDLSEMTERELQELQGVGASTAKKIREVIETGTMAKLDELRQTYPPDFVALSRIPGLGPKTLKLIRSRLGVENVEGLRTAIEAEQLRDLPGLGQKTEENIARAIDRLGLHGKEHRIPIADALPVARQVVASLKELPETQKAQYCGSLRRFRETIGDVDVLVSTRRPEPIMEVFVSLPMVAEVVARGETKSSILTHRGLQVDLRVVAPEEWGAAILYFTGSKAHNIKLRQLALDRGWTLNEYGLTDVESGDVVAAATEKSIYAALGLREVPTPLREDSGEVELAAAAKLPRLVQVKDLRGDLHYHTSLSGDGRASLEEMVAAAAERGYEYLAITDHGEDLTINGASRRQMLNQRKRVARLQESYPDMRLLHGCELNIGRDGGLDYDLDFLMDFDWCVASVHSHFDLDEAHQTERVLAAMANPAVNVVGHLSGRKIGRRPGIDLDVDRVMEAAAATGTAIEINGAIDRLDASADVLRRAGETGVTFVISTDSHHPDELVRAEYGVRNAQRGWVEKRRVANTWPQQKFLKWSRRKREGNF